MKEISKALFYASELHKFQKRKDEDETPYINHLIDVLNILSISNIHDTKVLVAGILHDTIEDTDIEADDLEKEFGEDITNIVLECSDDKSLPKWQRKIIQIETISDKSEEAALVKIADKISNLKSLINSQPKHWEEERIIGYILWSKAVVDPILYKNEGLRNIFEDLIDILVKQYNINMKNEEKILLDYIECLKELND